MIKLLYLPVFLFLNCSLNAQQESKTAPAPAFPASEEINYNTLYYEIITRQDHSYGYDVYAAGRLLIHQPNIPAIEGMRGFRKKKHAERTAKLVIHKIKKGEMPPSVEIEELRQMQVIKGFE